MAQSMEFQIKGAAGRPWAEHAQEEVNQPQTAEQRPDASPVAEPTGESQGVAPAIADAKGNAPIWALDDDDPIGYRRWYLCKGDPSEHNGADNVFYWVHMDTKVSQWEEPGEEYWIFDPVTQGADQEAGLQEPGAQAFEQAQELIREKTRRRYEDEVKRQKQEELENYEGYNPKIHGNYDPNAPYAQYHKRKREEEAAVATAGSGAWSAAALQSTHSDPAQYEAIMSLNRYTGHAQSADRGPERHSDAAKSSRQMGAFFDVDAAANSHDGRSLKSERKQNKLTKAQVAAYNKAKHEKKMKKKTAWLKS